MTSTFAYAAMLPGCIHTSSEKNIAALAVSIACRIAISQDRQNRNYNKYIHMSLITF